MSKFDRQPPKGRSQRADVHAKGAAHGKRAVYGTLTNLSATGAFLRAVRTLAVGDEVSLSFVLPLASAGVVSDVRVEVRAEVRHRGRGMDNGVGVQFIRLSRDAVEAIDAYVAQSAASNTGDDFDDLEIDVVELSDLE